MEGTQEGFKVLEVGLKQHAEVGGTQPRFRISVLQVGLQGHNVAFFSKDLIFVFLKKEWGIQQHPNGNSGCMMVLFCFVFFKKKAVVYIVYSPGYLTELITDAPGGIGLYAAYCPELRLDNESLSLGQLLTCGLPMEQLLLNMGSFGMLKTCVLAKGDAYEGAGGQERENQKG